MNWTKLNIKEVVYYCKSFEVGFYCEPFSLQMEELVLIFHFYGIEQFTVKDIQEFYEKLQEAWTEQETHKVGQLDRGNLLLKDLESKERQLWERLQRQGGILHRNPNTTSRELGNLRNYAEQQIKRKNSN